MLRFRQNENYLLDEMLDPENVKVLDRIGFFNADSIRNEFTSKYNKIEDIKVYSDTTDSTTHAIIELTFQHIDSLNNSKAFASSNFSSE